MELVLLIIALATCFYLVLNIIELVFGLHKIKNLATQPILFDAHTLPRLSIILSALNEERDIEQALLTLIHLDYPQLEIIVINDRSTDQTPVILDRLQAQYDCLKVLHIQALPTGWFGKNHALQMGASQAKGEWILFTDADVKMSHDTLLRSMSYVLTQQIDHLTIYENHPCRQVLMKIAFLGVYMAYTLVEKPWRVSYSWSKRSLGYGAFNLVKRSAYQQCGGHAAIAMECLDDMKLGALLKQHGFRQDTVDGRDFVQREWYASLPEMINGLKKNSFAYYHYRVFPAIRDVILALIFYIWPFFAVFLYAGMLSTINAMNILLTLCMGLLVAKYYRLKKSYALLYPVSLFFLIYSVLNSVFSICKHKGVFWRGTFYPLEVIKRKAYKKFN